MTSVVRESNWVIIPSEIAAAFNIQPGTRVEWGRAGTAGQEVITVKPIRGRGELARQLFGAGRTRLKPGAQPVKELLLARADDDALDQADERP